jgi:hypothetical protein
MANWALGVFRRKGLVVTGEARQVGRLQKELHDRVADCVRVILDVYELDRKALPKRLRRYVHDWPGSVRRMDNWRPAILDWLRHRHSSPSLAEVVHDAALANALIGMLLAANEEKKREAAKLEERRPAVRRLQ